MDEEFGEPLWRPLSDHDVWPAAYPAPIDGVLMTIGEMARESGATPRALRFYEDKGLISPQRQGVARLYGRADRERLTLIQKAKRLGFTLVEIRQMLAEPKDPAQARELRIPRSQCVEQIRHLEQRKREIESALAELRRTYSSFYARMVTAGG